MRRYVGLCGPLERVLKVRRAARALAFALLLPAFLGCGPLMSTYLIVSAQAELDGASAAEAEKYAVYEYTASSEYLAKAREEQGYADFGPAIDYAFKAQEFAVKAKARAVEQRDKLRAPGALPVDVSSSPAAEYEESPKPKVIIQKQPSSSDGAPVGVEIVPISPEQPE